MSLAAGRRLGPYEILSAIGAGGMGEVYRARDGKLSREVAIKVLPEDFAADAERLARFRREAQVLAALNHPHIAAIYGLEESGGVEALVLELVEGETLSERLAKGPLPVEEALEVARQIAEALEAAHEKGIVHRDLKPANVKLTPEGRVKVLDFGLAKALAGDSFSPDVSTSPTVTAGTQAGVILGTAAYMSPEQARGKAVDKRADIWAFGCVLYEMLAGKRAFEGETVSDTLAAVLKTEPDWKALPPDVPFRIRELLRRSLQKGSGQRLRDAGDARIEIEDTLAGRTGPETGREIPESVPLAFLFRRPAVLVLAAVLLGLSVAAGLWLGDRRASSAPGWTGDLLGGSNVAFGPRVSPDGRTIAFQAMIDNLTQVGVLDPVSGNWTLLTRDRSRGGVTDISWSPDGSKLYFDRVFSQPEGVYAVPSLGGEERLVLEYAGTPEALPDGSLLLLRVDPDRRQEIYHFWPDSGRLQALGGFPAVGVIAEFRAFPDGKEAVFFGNIRTDSPETPPRLYAMEIATGKARRLAPDLKIPASKEVFPVGVTPDNRAVLFDVPSGDLHRVVSIPRDGSGSIRTLVSLTRAPWFLDAAPDGALYFDQIERPEEILRFPVSGGAPEVLAVSEASTSNFLQPVEVDDGRFVLPASLAGHSRLLIGKPGGNFFPLVDIADQSSPPAASLPGDEVAFVAGTGAEQVVAIASARDGRLVRRLRGTQGKAIEVLATSPDGATIYYVSSRSVWAIPAADGVSRKICSGDGVAADPGGASLIVTRNGKAGASLFRVPLSGRPEQEIRVNSDLRIVPISTGGRAVSRDGRILVGVVTTDVWFYQAAVLDPATGRLTRIPVRYPGDVVFCNWTADGRVLATGFPLKGRIWRFRPAGEVKDAR